MKNPDSKPVVLELKKTAWGKRKYRKGQHVKNMVQLLQILDTGGWVYMNHKVLHPRVVENMSLTTLKGFIQGSRMFIAEENENGRE